MPKTLVSGPSSLPLSIIEAKAHLNVDFDDDDLYILSLIKAVTADAENYLRRAIITQTWDLLVNGFADFIELPMPALQSVLSVTYLDTNGNSQTLDESVYDVDKNAEPGAIRLAYGKSWPSVRNTHNSVTIRFVAGYADAVAVPMPIKQAMLLHLAHLYENRDTIVVGTVVAYLPAYSSLMSSYRIY